MAKRKYSWCFALLVASALLWSRAKTSEGELVAAAGETLANANVINRGMPCEEIYVVRDGETLQTISAKCEDPFILENNPHIYDPDDVYPGLVITITPFRERQGGA
ncbi:LysM domain-containing protein [Psidium guajava]|nr:LysM domain-containing protein [Psidium guajava]